MGKNAHAYFDTPERAQLQALPVSKSQVSTTSFQGTSNNATAIQPLAAVPPCPRLTSTPQDSSNKSNKWECTLCGCKMEMSSKHSHLTGKKHALKAARATVAPGSLVVSNLTSDRSNGPNCFEGSHPQLVTELQEPAFSRWVISSTTNRRLTGAGNAAPSNSNHNFPRSSTKWQCLICQTIFDSSSKDTHLRTHFQSTRHVSARSSTWMELDIPIHRQPASTSLARSDKAKVQVKWECTDCDLEMDASCKSSHIAGKKHHQRVAKSTAQVKWECTDCDLKMDVSCKSSHISGKKHSRRVAKLRAHNIQITSRQHRSKESQKTDGPLERAPSKNPPPTEKKLNRRLTEVLAHYASLGSKSRQDRPDNQKMDSLHESKNLSQRIPIQRATELYVGSVSKETRPKWECTICQFEMDLSFKDSHLAGKNHARRITTPKQVTIPNDQHQLRSRLPARTGTVPTPQPMDDIDLLCAGGTQWDACQTPRGSRRTHKGSERFWESGIHLYY